MKNNYFSLLTLLLTLSLGSSYAQNLIATEVIVANGESFGTNASNIGSYDLINKTYTVFDTLGTNSIQDVLVEETTAFVAAQTKIISYDLDTKTKIAEVSFPGASSNTGSIFTDDNNVFVGNWYGQTDSNLYAFNKTTLNYEFAVTEATLECGGGLSLNDTLYIGQKGKSVIDDCAPYGCFADSTGSIVIADAITGAFYRTIDLGTAGAGISQIYNEGNYIFAVCETNDKILKIEIGTDIVTEISVPSFTQSVLFRDAKLYLDFNETAGYIDLTDESIALSSRELKGTALAYDPNNETAFSTTTDYFSFGALKITNDLVADSVMVGISPEAIDLVFKMNNSPVTANDSFEYIYTNDTSEYQLDVLANDTDADNETLTITNVSTPNVIGATAVIDGQEIKYTRAAGIATTDYFTYTACDGSGACSTSTVYVLLKSLTSVKEINLTQQISVYPNPATDYLKIQVDDLTIEKVVLSTILGENVKISKESKIRLENIDKGLYFVTVYTNKGTTSTKVLVK